MARRKPLVRLGGKDRQLPAADVLDIDLWAHMPIGSPFPVWTHLIGVTAPPTDNANYRYIKLTASDSYNTGVLTGESVSGSAPLVQATAVINDAGSPMNGQAVRLINTERRVLRPGSSGTVEAAALQGHGHDFYVGNTDQAFNHLNTQNQLAEAANAGGRSLRSSVLTGEPLQIVGPVSDGVNGTPSISNETRPKNIGADYFMRIR